ncbi:MAG: hypothetical protein WHS63_00560 [Tenuifilum sp.]|uniref:hypothetical protein n=1 Tax=Tenuifilum sp. TaxID=2760880 RepID=UPI0030A2FC9F
MASVKDLKKDIKQMTKHLLDECYTQLTYSEPISKERILDIISDIMVLEQETISKISKKTYKRGESTKVDYQKIANDFYDEVVELAERINSLDE